MTGLLDDITLNKTLFIPRQAGIKPLWQNVPGYHTLVQENTRKAKGLVKNIPEDKPSKRLPQSFNSRVKEYRPKIKQYVEKKTPKPEFNQKVIKARKLYEPKRNKPVTMPVKAKYRHLKPLPMPGEVKVSTGPAKKETGQFDKPKADDKVLAKLESKLTKLNAEVFGILKEIKSIRETT